MKKFACVCALFAAVSAVAGEWKGLEEDNWIFGRKMTAADLRRKVVFVVDWDVNAASAAEDLLFVQKNVIGQKNSGHPVEIVASCRSSATMEEMKAAAPKFFSAKCPVYQGAEFSDAPGNAKLPFYYVVDPTRTVRYAGNDKNDAVVAMVEILTDLPGVGQILGGVPLKKFKNLQKTLVMGKKAEGAALASVRTALKSKKPAEAEEAQAVLDAVEKAKQNLKDEIKECLEAGDKGTALRDIRWFCQSWPSEKEQYVDDFKKLAADPEARAAEAALLKAMKKRK